jgi:lipopolysaccharide export system protein LptA
MRWQRVARIAIALVAVAFAVVVALGFKRRPAPGVVAPVRADPGAVVEVTGGRVGRFKFSREDMSVDCEKQFVYPDGTTKLMGVTIVTEDRASGRSFTVKGKEGAIGQNESTMVLNGAVQLDASDGMAVRTEHARYASAENMVHAEGPVAFSRGAMTGSGVGMTYDTTADRLAILAQAVVHVAPDAQGAGALDVAAGAATFARREHEIHFEGEVKLQRGEQVLEADMVVAHLSDDEKQIQSLDLRGRSRITMAKPTAGGLQTLASHDMDLTYGPDGQTLEHAVLLEEAAIVLAGDGRSMGRQITAKTIDVALAPDGVTPVALQAKEAVQLTLPAEDTLPARTIRSSVMRADGQPGRGLTHAVFDGAVEYTERGTGVNRIATAGALDVALKPAMAGFQDARFGHAVRFVDGGMTATAAAARYDLDKGMLNLTGSEPGSLTPHVINDKIAVDAKQVDITLAGPRVMATGTVKSVLQPAKSGRAGGATPDTRLPSMFKRDKAVNVTADSLDYSGAANKATYTGKAQLWQDETSVKGQSIVLDDKTGDLTAGGGVATVTVRNELDATQKTQRVRSVATATDFHYDDAAHRTTYTGGAHMISPSGDITAAKIELYLAAGSDDLDRVEAYDTVTLRDRSQTTTGARLTYTTADDRYLVGGTPVKIVDACGRETIGRTLTYLKSTETVVVDGNEQTRTQTKGSGPCP